MSKVTIAVPTYNRPEFLAESLRSILNQAFQDFEIIIFDNHSDYDVRAALKAKALDDPRISLIQTPVNLGGPENFHRIFRQRYASEYVMVFHDDDTMHPELLSRQLKVMESRADAIWAGTDLRFVHRGARMGIFAEAGPEIKFGVYDKVGIVRLLLTNFNLAFDTVLYRSRYLEDIEPFNRDFSKWGDRPYLVRLAEKGSVVVLKERLVNYRMHPGQDSKLAPVGQADFIFKLYGFYRDNLPQPLLPVDEKLFRSWAANNSVLPAAAFVKNFHDYRKLLWQFKDKGFFDYRYINARGIWYFLKAIKKFI
ncbi:MAG: glycosyltransferase family 2 protein [Candidatus Doudnabacteria bacterium]|nr:glycosyltransferase family 2 protein [Candidatus Doudnabacteria bacterium]